MENIINVPFKRKNTPDSDIFIVDRIEGEFVIFKNNARCSLSMLQTDFEPAQTNENNVNTMEPVINPETFFDTPISENDGLLDQIETAVKNPNALPQQSERLKESVPLDNAIQPNLLNRLDNNDAPYEAPQNTNVQNAPAQNRLPEWDVFDRVKKAEEIEILVPFKIKLPRPEKIDALNDMFETSFTMYLAKQYIKDNVVNNSIPIQKLIQTEIENWMENELYGSSKRKKPAKKTQPAKKTKNVITETVDETEELTQTVDNKQSEELNAMSFFNKQQQPTWDGNIKKLFIINTEEQFNAVNKELNRLKENNSKSTDVDKYEDMVQTYKENNGIA